MYFLDVGGTFDVLAGSVKRAPEFLYKSQFGMVISLFDNEEIRSVNANS